MDNTLNNNSNYNKLIVDLATSSLEGNISKIELVLLSLARSSSKDNPDLSKKIKEIISLYSIRGSSAMRSAGSSPVPIDGETQLEMASIVMPNPELNVLPVLNLLVQEKIETFLEERRKISMLLEKNIRPSNSLLLIGQPGTGKTMLARYIATSLDKNLIVLDLSASMSSLLGKTGHNLKKVLQYAKQSGSVLLLDEFDAIAKRRDDNTDLGEIKRVVNVLLMELEDWPISSVLIATSNHPELLDRAIWRRFDHVIEVPLPGIEQKYFLLQQQMGFIFSNEKESKSILYPAAELLSDKSAADICKFSNNIRRRVILKDENPMISCIQELRAYNSNKKIFGKFCILAKEKLRLTVREIAAITGLSPAGVQYHLAKNKNDD